MAFEGKRFYGLICVCLSLFFFLSFKIFSHKCLLVLLLVPNVYIYINYLLATRSSSLLELPSQTSTFARNLIDLSIELSGYSKNQIKISFPFLSSEVVY